MSSGFEVVLLGTGSPLPDPNRAGPSTLVRAGGATLLVDCGRGVSMRMAASGAGAPAVGDLVVFDRGGTGVLDHIGIVTGVAPGGAIQTVEGNSGDAVSARSYGPGEYAGLVRLG